MENSNGGLNWKKLKDWYSKLRLFKVWVLNCKNDERSEVISEVFPERMKMKLNQSSLKIQFNIWLDYNLSDKNRA
jgi:hypothetical protein